MHLLDFLAYVLAILVSLPLLVLATECFLSLLPGAVHQLGERGKCVVLVPAHDEEVGLAATIRNILAQTLQGDRIIVVADNCTDSTAKIASELGVEVVERHDSTRRGKGYALDAGVEQIRQQASARGLPDVVVVLDADCLLGEAALDILVRSACTAQCTQQAQYLMHEDANAKPTRRLSMFAFLTKNWVRPRGLARLDMSVPLTGSGMAFPWSVISACDLGTSEIVEDLDLGLQLVLDGRGAKFCEAARVDSFFPSTDEAARQQHQRWEHGYLSQMKRKLPVLLFSGLRGNLRAFIAGLDLMVPPISLLVISAAAVSCLLTVNYLSGGVWLPLAITLVACTACSCGLLAVWMRFGRDVITAAELVWLPVYAGKKLYLYLSFPFASAPKWLRTQRGSGSG